MIELTPYEDEQNQAIKAWEKQEPSVLAKAGGVIAQPVAWFVNKIIPKKVLEGALSACNAAGGALADKGDILRDGGVTVIGELKTKDLALSDKLANGVHNWAIGLATAEGAGAGYFGLGGMLVDIPTLITLAYRTMHKIGLCYGYECTSYEDKMFLNFIISSASANSVEEKALCVVGLQQLNVLIAKTTWRKMAEKAAANKMSKEAVVMFIRAFAKSLGINLTKRKALQAIPVVGGVVGAAMNASFIQDVAWAARRNFQKRWLMENEKIPLESVG